MPVVHITPAERQGMRVGMEMLTSPATLGRLAIRMFKGGGIAHTFPPDSMISLVPETLRGRAAEAWIHTHEGMPAERATLHVFQSLQGPVHAYDSEAGAFTRQPAYEISVPPAAMPLAEISPLLGCVVYSLTLHLPADALPAGQVRPFPM